MKKKSSRASRRAQPSAQAKQEETRAAQGAAEPAQSGPIGAPAGRTAPGAAATSPAAPEAGRGNAGKAVPAAAEGLRRQAGRSAFDRAFVILFPVVLFLAMTAQTTRMALALAVAAFALSIGKTPLATLRLRLSVPVCGFAAFLLICMAAGLYSSFGDYAIQEYVKLLASGSIGLTLLLRGRREDVRPLLWGFAAVCAVIAVLCVDFGCGGPLFRGFAQFMDLLGAGGYLDMTQVDYTGARFDGIYADANLTGSLLGLAMLVCFYLMRTARDKKEGLAAAFLLGLSSVSFLVATSRGAILSFGAAVAVYLVAAGKGERLRLFFLMLAAGISTAVFGVLSVLFLSQGSVLGTVMTLPCGPVIWLLDSLMGERAAGALAGKGKLVAGAVGGLAVLAVAAVVLAFNLTEPFAFTRDNVLYRIVPATPGETYTISGDWDGGEAVTVLVYGSNAEQALMNQRETYYNGPLAAAQFTVPEDVDQIYLQFRSTAGGELRSAQLSDGTKIPMEYTLLPANIADRFQGDFLQNYSFLQRVQYYKDGWSLFLLSPVYGHGLGATEGLLTAVQPYFYESLYLHNHILQVMDESGLVGLAAFLCLLAGAAWMLVKKLRGGQNALAAALLACCAMMNVHGLMEISFSVRMFQCAAFCLLMLAVIDCAPEKIEKKKRRGAAIAVSCCIWVWIVASFGLVLGNYVASSRFANLDTSGMTVGDFMDTMEDLDRIDFYSDTEYKVNLMANALQQGEMMTATRCARELASTGEFDACYQAAAYYYLPLRRMPDFFACVQDGLRQERSNPDAWNSAFHLYAQAFEQLSEEEVLEFIDGVVETGARMDEANEVLIQDITLDEQSQSLLNGARSVREEQMDAAAAYVALSLVLGGELS